MKLGVALVVGVLAVVFLVPLVIALLKMVAGVIQFAILAAIVIFVVGLVLRLMKLVAR